MNKTIVLIAGYPGTGKTYLANQLIAKNPLFEIVSQDEIKEIIWDAYGFQNQQEKDALIERSRWVFCELLKATMQTKELVIADYPFSERQKPMIETFAKQYHFQVITIRLVGDLDVLFARQSQRDLDSQRHLAHIMSHYVQGDVLVDRSMADGLLSYKEFYKRCTTRGYGTFALGKLYEIDTSDFALVHYNDLLDEILSIQNP